MSDYFDLLLLNCRQQHCCVGVCAGATDDAINAAREAFHRHLAATQKSQQHVQDTSEEDLSQADERELDAEFAGQSRVVSSDHFSVLGCS